MHGIAPTLSDAHLATVFPLPMNPTPGTPEARLSNVQFADRAYDAMPPTLRANVTPLCSRDANSEYQDAGFDEQNLVASARAEVWFTDRFNWQTGANEGLGRFTVLRIRIQDLPQAVRDRLINSVQDPIIAALIAAASTTTENVGWLYMAYAHQSFIPPEIDSRPTIAPNYPVVQPLQSVGESGNSGLGGIDNKHLDVSVFYVSGKVNHVNGITIPALEPNSNAWGYDLDYQIYFNLYQSPGDDGFGLVELLDPLIWPLLEEGWTNVDTTCP